tara:strand:+ start:36 stop:245 length:210 start_codon:yes stop_codon:yes gene_type:complete
VVVDLECITMVVLPLIPLELQARKLTLLLAAVAHLMAVQMVEDMLAQVMVWFHQRVQLVVLDMMSTLML